jgi:hypothetical protein
MDAHLHVDLPTQLQQTRDQLRQVTCQVLQIHQHVHHEKPPHHTLFNVLDVDPALGHVGGKLGHHPLLVLAEHADDGQHWLSHDPPPLKKLQFSTPSGRQKAPARARRPCYDQPADCP